MVAYNARTPSCPFNYTNILFAFSSEVRTISMPGVSGTRGLPHGLQAGGNPVGISGRDHMFRCGRMQHDGSLLFSSCCALNYCSRHNIEVCFLFPNIKNVIFQSIIIPPFEGIYSGSSKGVDLRRKLHDLPDPSHPVYHSETCSRSRFACHLAL